MFKFRHNRCITNNTLKENQKENKFLIFLYETFLGRVLLKITISKPITKLMGLFYSSHLSRFLIKGYINKNQIDMNIYEEKDYTSFNDFFIRKKKEIIFSDKDYLISPCDGYLTKYQINKDLTVKIKNSTYDIKKLLQDEELAKQYEGGDMLIFRLMPFHYHRFHFICDGYIKKTKNIPGIFHTVRPVALYKYPVFCENQREYSILNTQKFGTIIMMEVGALGVGKIVNHNIKNFTKGQEKGYFKFGGSTIILLIKKGHGKYQKYQKYFTKEVEVECGSVL